MSEYQDECPVEPGRKCPWTLFSKISSVVMIVGSFIQAVCGDGLGAIEFWFSLCFAAAQRGDDKRDGASHRDRDEVRHRQVM